MLPEIETTDWVSAGGDLPWNTAISTSSPSVYFSWEASLRSSVHKTVLCVSYKTPLVFASGRWDHRKLGSETIKGQQLYTDGRKRRNSSQHSEDGEEKENVALQECAGNSWGFVIGLEVLVFILKIAHWCLTLTSLKTNSLYPPSQLEVITLTNLFPPRWQSPGGGCMREATQEGKQRTKTKS